MTAEATKMVILVDEADNPVGEEEKLQAHKLGLCHRAFSVLIFRNHNGLELLLQQRAKGKYHCAGLWTNTCCSHPGPGEETKAAAESRLQMEMGVDAPLTHAGTFHYTAPFKNGLTENEVDHVFYAFVGNDCEVKPNPAEASDYRWIRISQLISELNQKPKDYTPWFQQALQIALNHMNEETVEHG